MNLNLKTNQNNAFHFFALTDQAASQLQLPPQIGQGVPKVSCCIAHCAAAQVALHAADHEKAGAGVSIVQLQEVLQDPVIKLDAEDRQRRDHVIDQADRFGSRGADIIS